MEFDFNVLTNHFQFISTFKVWS